jgi:hypothetical protein
MEGSVGSPTPITDFLFRLEVDSQLAKQYAEDPEEALKLSGLSQEARDAFTSGDLRRLQELVDAEHPGSDNPGGSVALMIRGWIKGPSGGGP